MTPDIGFVHVPGLAHFPLTLSTQLLGEYGGKSRLLVPSYKLLPEVSEAMIYIAMVRLMLRRLTKNKLAAL